MAERLTTFDEGDHVYTEEQAATVAKPIRAARQDEEKSRKKFDKMW